MKNCFHILLFIFLVCFCYDANGNNTFEGTRTRVTYNEINLPQQVQLLGGRGIKNIYAADGRKLKTETRQGTEYIKEGTKTYSGNLVFDINDELDYIIFDEGRILYNIDDSTFKFEYHLRDHLGSTRVAFVPTVSGIEVVQENNYYPFGAPINDLSWSPKSTNRYLREGKEYISDFDWNKYDFTGRTFDSWALRALQVDPMAAEYYGSSPYALWAGNPIRVIDPTGMTLDWYEDIDKTLQYNPNVKSQADLKNGQKYIGETHQVRDSKGNITDYRADGSIMFGNETAAYQRMWNQANKYNREQLAVIGDNTILVLPEYLNDNTTSEVKKYGYKFENGQLMDIVTKSTFSTLATIHTHQDDLQGEWGYIAPPGVHDDIYFTHHTPNKPYFTMGYDNRIHGSMGNLTGLHQIELPKRYNTIQDLLNGAKFKWLIKQSLNGRPTQ